MKIMSVFGTRPEAIKMAPVIKELNKYDEVENIVCVTGQHKEMLDQVLDTFSIIPDYNLKIMKDSQTLFTITQNILEKIEKVLRKEKPDIVLVHGDTSTTFVTSLACFYLQIPVGHIEAGLRTNKIYSPFPEEFNRQAVSLIARFNFAPTESAKQNLISEGKDDRSIFVTGNTVIDALKTTVSDKYKHKLLQWTEGYKMILLTAHRRENQGEALKNIFNAAVDIVNKYEDVKIISPVHLNPNVQKVAKEIMGNHPRIKLVDPLEVIDFHNIMANSFLILSDSGGIQEEAPYFGIPVLVLRDTTERPEGVDAGTLKLVGNDRINIVSKVSDLLENNDKYMEMVNSINPYGDGEAAKRIVDVLLK